MDRLGIYQNIISHLEDVYKSKNSDYGGSASYAYEKYGDLSFMIRITDKFKRLESLSDANHEIQVQDEKLEDTILDLANYCLLWLTEREFKNLQFKADFNNIINTCKDGIDATAKPKYTTKSVD